MAAAPSKRVALLLGDLQRLVKSEVDGSTVHDEQCCEIISELKVLGRDVANAGPIFQKDGILILGHCAFRVYEGYTRLEALRCLANALLLNPPSRQIFVDCDFASNVADQFRDTNIKDDAELFVTARLLFLLTYETTLDFVQLVREHKIANRIFSFLVVLEYQSQVDWIEGRELPSTLVLVLQEVMKLQFNLTHLFPTLAPDFTPNIKPILTLLCNQDYDSEALRRPLQPPITQLLNALTSLDWSKVSEHDLHYRDDPSGTVKVLMRILDKCTRSYTADEMEKEAAPLLLVLRQFANTGDEGIKQSMRAELLPREDEREKPLGQSDTLFSRLLQLSMSPSTPTLRDTISGLMFELSDKDVNTFIKNVGYGYAAGFLANNNIPLTAPQAEGDATTGESSSRTINPVTGQYVDQEKEDNLPPMTEEEKEREAERLFVLFERLKKNGMISVKNPVEEAIQSGRFEELE